ncbi:MAG: hypothetical protein HYT30_01040 [Parcubacteria group bacterium]|nr:hypothetical protein [Parcubacteria group bacterium]
MTWYASSIAKKCAQSLAALLMLALAVGGMIFVLTIATDALGWLFDVQDITSSYSPTEQ